MIGRLFGTESGRPLRNLAMNPHILWIGRLRDLWESAGLALEDERG